MDCQKCLGQMIEERFQDLLDDTGQIHFYGFRCINCGDIIDPVIIKNREEHANR